MSDNDPFANIVDDSAARRESEDWAFQQIGQGRTAEDVAADLVATGWPADDAESIAEAGRVRTKHRRGVVTRADAARATGIGDPTVMGDATPMLGGTSSGRPFSGGLVGAILRLFTTRPRPPRGG